MNVTIEMPTKRLRSRPGDLKRALESIPVRVAHTMASLLLNRVSLQGRHHQGFTGYSTKLRRYISPRYPVLGNKKADKTGTFMFKNSAAFHRSMGTRTGSFNVNRNNGMWSGLSVIFRSAKRAHVKFRGRSEGQGMIWHKPTPAQLEASAVAKEIVKVAKKSGTHKKWKGQKPYEAIRGQIVKSPPGPHWRVNAKGVKVAKGRKVSNALKAWTVFAKSNVNVLAPTISEIKGLSISLTAETAKNLARQWNIPIRNMKIPQHKIDDILRRAKTMTANAKLVK